MYARNKHDQDCPALWVEVGFGGFSCGTGFYSASTGYMQTLREVILSGAPVFTAANEALDAGPFTLGGDAYKKSRFPDAPEGQRRWLDRKGIYVMYEEQGYARVFREDFHETVCGLFHALAPCYRFFLHVHSLNAGR